jgi:hypothetical protein
MERRVGPIDLGGGHFVGAPGQPMGTCAYCGTGIADCRLILSSDGKRFIVGNECVRHTGDEALIQEAERFTREQARLKRAEKGERDRAELKALLGEEAVVKMLEALPHPTPYMAEKGHRLLGYMRFMVDMAGASGAGASLRWVKRLRAEALAGREAR